jgi:biopolymer transport protein TolQ
MEVTENLDQVVTTASTNASIDISVMSLISSADMVGKMVMLALFLASLWSWTIIVQKYLLLSSTKKKMSKFEDIFWSGQVIDDLYERVRKLVDNPLSAIFVNAMEECKKSKVPDNKKTDAFRLSQKERVSGAMCLVKNRELEYLDKSLGFLATVGSSAPFIGLFGTVWGIMHSFQSIAASKNTSLAVVAPGIAEALLATAIGLFVAIPATIFYNYLSSEIDAIDNKAEDFMGELSCLISRAIDEERM